MSDRASNALSTNMLHVVHLHGDVHKPEHGYIFSDAEYNKVLNNRTHAWYQQARDDYIEFTPIFIGTKIEERILLSELDRAREAGNTGLGMAFLVTPTRLSTLKIQALAKRNISVVTGDLADFTEWLRREVGPTVSPTEVVEAVSAFARLEREGHRCCKIGPHNRTPEIHFRQCKNE
jgi:hypothetical protein